MLRVLIIGAGDVAKRILPLLVTRCQVHAVLRDAGKASWWRDHGAIPVIADLDRPESVNRLRGLLHAAHWVIHLAPPADAESGRMTDSRTLRLLAANACRKRLCSLSQRWVYISTTGVYGDLGGAWADETASCRPTTLRGRRRLAAERLLRSNGTRASILRVPGIYAADRLPTGRLKSGTPVLAVEDDVYTNHIHADDLARIVVAALRHGQPARIYHAVDDSALKMGDYFDAVADIFGMPRPPRIGRNEAAGAISPAMLAFMTDSRRLSNRRLKCELFVCLRYPTVQDGLRAAVQTGIFLE